MIPVISAFRAHRHKTFVGFLLAISLTGCFGGGPSATLTVGAEGFEPPIVTVEAGRSFDLEIANETRAVQTVTVEGRPPLRVAPGETGTRQIDSLPAGERRVTLEGAPFEATVRAEE